LAVAILGVWGGAREGPRTRVVVLDRSRSLSSAVAQCDQAVVAALAGWRDARDTDRVALVVCAAESRVLLEPTSPSEVKARLAELLAAPVDDWGTDLRGGLKLAAGLLPPTGGEVLLISDGRDPAAAEGVEELLARGVPVHCFVPRGGSLAGVRLAGLEGPSHVAPGAAVTLRATLEAARETRAELWLEEREGRAWRVLHRRALVVSAGVPLAVQLPWSAPRRGVALTLRVRVRAQGVDRSREDDMLEHSLRVGRGRRVVVCGRPLPTLASRTLSVTSIRPSELGVILRDPPELLVLSSVSAAAMADAVPALETALRAGMGLVVCGLKAFGPGGYAETPLEGLLPVRSGPAQERARRLALVVCLDASGSMARPAARSRYLQAIESGIPWSTLRAEDSLGVVLFADQPRVAAPLGPLKAELRGALAGEIPKGGTDLGAALARGLELLAASEAEERLLVLASDAEDDPAGSVDALGALAESLAKSGQRAPRVLLVGIGARSLEAYQTLAKALRPLSVEVARSRDAGDSLRALLQSELAARQHSVREGPFGLTLTPAGEERQLFLPELVESYVPVRVRTEPAAAAQLLGSVVDPEGGQGPWGVLGRCGRGRVAALPLAGAVATPLISGLAGELLRPRKLGLELTRTGTSLGLISSGEALPAKVRLEARALRPDEGPALSWDLPLTPVSPHRARATLSRREAPGVGLLLTVLGSEGVLLTRSLPPRAHEELALGEPDYEGLSRLARESGGVMLAGPNEPLPEPPPPAPFPWAPLAAGLAALLITGELALGGVGAARARARAAAALQAEGLGSVA
ncbi:MAG: VWA domain-containing protein, partial [Planctomycetes bacterium]|nr:VWA domain-containing protein [Planctomycetota bacterium]